VYNAAHCATDGGALDSTSHMRHEISVKTAMNDKGTIGKREQRQDTVVDPRSRGSCRRNGSGSHSEGAAYTSREAIPTAASARTSRP